MRTITKKAKNCSHDSFQVLHGKSAGIGCDGNARLYILYNRYFLQVFLQVYLK